MKRIIAITLSALMLFIVCSCAKPNDGIMGNTDTTDITTNDDTSLESDDSKDTNSGDSETNDPPSSNDAPTTPEQPVPEKTQTTYLSPDVSSKMEEFFKNDFSHFSAYSTGSAPYALQDVFTISNTKVLSITIPVYKVGVADTNGDYTFTLYVVSNSLNGLKRAPLRTYSIKLNKNEYGFSDNLTVNRFVKVDLKSYNIALSDSETFAWFSATDTVIPAYISAANSSTKAFISEKAPWTVGFFSKVGTADMATSLGALLMDFEFERNDLNSRELAYEKLVEQLKDKYSGKYVSVVGDSISTYENYSNNTSYNSTIGSNEIYYKTASLATWQCTYWGRLINDLDMKLCVNNSRSGKTAYGVSGLNYADSSIFRATELDNDNGTPNDPSDDIAPDVILYYLGINDITLNSPFGDLYDLLKNANEDIHEDIVEAWFADVLTATQNGTNIVHGTTITSYEQAYAMTLYKMKTTYPNVEIYCLDLIENETKTPAVIDKYNLCIHAIAEYFDVNLVEHRADSGIGVDNYHAYMADKACLHPSPSGFYQMTKVIMETMSKASDEKR